MSARTVHRKEFSCFTLRGADWLRLAPQARSSVVERAFEYWRERGFPHYRLDPAEISQEMSTLLRKDAWSVFNGKDLRSSNAGLRLANSFQPRMWSARVNRYLSPMQVFEDDELLRKAIKRSLTIWPDRFGANASCLRRMLKTFPGAASVSNYRPMVAKAIMSRYCPKSGVIVDFAAGYGGRLLGAIAANRDYIGIEPNLSQIKGFTKMARAIAAMGFQLPHLTFLNGPAERELPVLKGRSADLIFSSPPFFNWEHYSRSKDQSFKQYPVYESWLTWFLTPAIVESYRILKEGGYLVLNVTNGKRLPTPEDVSNLARKAGFRLGTVYEMVFPKVPYLHPRGGGPVKRELIVVFPKQAQRR